MRVERAGREVPDGLLFLDGEGAEVQLDDQAAQTLLALTSDLVEATVSACPGCRSRVVAAVALVDVLDACPPHPRGPELVELADDAPTLHLYVVDGSTKCDHGRWLDPGYGEWLDALAER